MQPKVQQKQGWMSTYFVYDLWQTYELRIYRYVTILKMHSSVLINMGGHLYIIYIHKLPKLLVPSENYVGPWTLVTTDGRYWYLGHWVHQGSWGRAISLALFPISIQIFQIFYFALFRILTNGSIHILAIWETYAVVTCGNRTDLMVSYQITMKWLYKEIWISIEKSLVKVPLKTCLLDSMVNWSGSVEIRSITGKPLV